MPNDPGVVLLGQRTRVVVTAVVDDDNFVRTLTVCVECCRGLLDRRYDGVLFVVCRDNQRYIHIASLELLVLMRGVLDSGGKTPSAVVFVVLEP